MKASRQFMILKPAGEPASPFEPLGSFSEVAWPLRAHPWHLATTEPVGEDPRPAKTLTRPLSRP